MSCRHGLKKGIFLFSRNIKKNTLLQLCKSNCKTPPVRAVDKIIAEAGHEVLRLPPLHVTPEQWSNYVTHTDNLIRKYWEKERWVTVNELVIDLSIDSDDSDSDFNFEL
jgi:hypothetical protein